MGNNAIKATSHSSRDNFDDDFDEKEELASIMDAMVKKGASGMFCSILKMKRNIYYFKSLDNSF